MQIMETIVIKNGVIQNGTVEQARILREALQELEFHLGISRYSTGKIYKIINITTGEIAYIGSTIKPLNLRQSGHKSFFKLCPASPWTQYVMANGGVSNLRIELIEDYPCRTLQELIDRERHYILFLNPICNINLRNPRPSDEDDAEDEEQNIRDYEIIDANGTCELAIEKKWFETVIAIHDDVTESATIFNAMSASKVRQIIINLYVEHAWRNDDVDEFKTESLALLQGSRTLTKRYRKAFDKAFHIIPKMRQVTSLLGLESSHDVKVINDDVIEHKQHELCKVLQELKEVVPSVRIRHEKMTGVPAIRHLLNSILQKYANLKLVEVSNRRMPTADGTKTRKWVRQSQIVVDDVVTGRMLSLLTL